MKILITGATGFIGGYIVSQLIKNPEFFIIATGRSKISAFESFKNITYIQADLANHFPEIDCDVCIHCAGLADDQSSQKEFEINNVSATKNLMESLKECKTFIFISSSSVYNFKDEKIKNEDDAHFEDLDNEYGRSKLKAENLIISEGIPSIYILRPRAVYGVGDRVLLPRILKLIKKNIVLVPNGLAKNSSLTYVGNLFEAIQKAMVQSANGVHIFNIADDYVYSLHNIFAMLSLSRYQHSNFIYIPKYVIMAISKVSLFFKFKNNFSTQAIDYITRDSVLSIEKAKQELEYIGKINFHERIDELSLKKRN